MEIQAEITVCVHGKQGGFINTTQYADGAESSVDLQYLPREGLLPDALTYTRPAGVDAFLIRARRQLNVE